MSKINRSLHTRFNRNHSPKCISWDGSNTTSKITCVDNNRSVKRGNDWTISCIVNNNGNLTLPCIYSDYVGSFGLFIGLNNSSSPTSTFLNIIIKDGTTTGITFDLGGLYINNWVCVTISYNSSTNEATIYVNETFIDTKVLSVDFIWEVGTTFGVFCSPTGASSLMEGFMSTYCILDKQADSDFIENFSKFGLPDEASFANVTFFADLSKVNDQGTYTGLDCSTRFFNPSSTTKQIEFVGWTDEELGLDVETNGISANCLMKEFYSEGSPYELNGSTVVEKDSGFPTRRNGLRFEASKEQYLNITNVPQIDSTKGFTLLMSVKDFDVADKSNLVFLGSSSLNSAISISLRRDVNPALDKKIGFRQDLGNNLSETQFTGIDETHTQQLVMRRAIDVITTPKNQDKEIFSVNKETKTASFPFITRTDLDYSIDVGSTVLDMTLEGLVLVRGTLQDSEIKEIMGVGAMNNIPLSLQQKYDFDLILDLNKDTYYDDAGTLKLKDLSSNNLSVEAISNNSLGWQTLTDLQNSSTQL